MRTFASRDRSRKGFGVGLALLTLIFATHPLVARADDPAARRAARLSFLQGNVTVDHLDNTAGDPAQLNMPLPEGARLTTGEDGEAELEFEDGSIIRVTPNSSVGLNTLSVDASGTFHTNLTVLHGLIYAELRAATKFTYSVNVDGEVISPVANASVRINLDEPPPIISVLDGIVHIERASSATTNGYKTDVHAGEALTSDAADRGLFFLLKSVEPETWDVWNQERDQAAADAAANRTTARDDYAGDQGYGWADLDANGSWYNLPGQGQVWQPTIAADEDFDPYGYGSWIAYPGAGYVWASGYGWGWTPFHCGSWSYWNSFGWGWSPGPGCGLAGWGSGGVVYVINVIHPPLNYRLPTRPVHTPGIHPHPVPIGPAPGEPGTGLRPSLEPRSIAGVSVEPLRPIGNPSATKSQTAVGSALRSDFAVDHTSHQPVMGSTTSASPATSRGDYRSVSPRTETPTPAAAGADQPGRLMRPVPPPQQAPSYPAPTRGEYSAPRPSAPVYAPRPAPPPSPPPTPRSAPAAPAPAAPK
jgi:FecR protein